MFFNGPPRCGKDTAALYTMSNFDNVGFERFAFPCKFGFAGMAGESLIESYDSYGNIYPFENVKDEVIPWLGVSYRQWQIDFSEKFMKPLYGDDIFARLLKQRVGVSKHRVLVIPDSGFASEVEPVAQAFGLDNIMLVRIYRRGCDFSNDSRSYLGDVVPNVFNVSNDSTIEAFHDKLCGPIADFLATV